MSQQESSRIRFWAFSLIVLTMAAVLLTAWVYPFEVSLAYLALLAGVIAVGLITNVWLGVLASAVAVFVIVLVNQYLGIYPRENWFFNIATGLTTFLLAGPFAGVLASRIEHLQTQVIHWLAQTEAQTVHDDLLGTLKPHWAVIRLDEEIARTQRYGRSLSLVLLELVPSSENTLADRPERVAALQALVRIARAATLPPEIISHAGGNQLLLILPEHTPDQANQLAQTLADRLNQERYFPDETPLGKPLREWGQLRTGIVHLNGRSETSQSLIAHAKAALDPVGQVTNLPDYEANHV